jgi:hypothetical protein
MKTYFNKTILILGGLGILLTNACTKLDEKVYSKMSESTYYKTEADFIGALAPVYGDFRILFDWQRWWDLQETADICLTPTRGGNWYDGGMYQRYHKHTWTANEIHFSNTWADAYAGISDCNKFIYQIENTSVPIVGKGKYIAEVKCVRAFWYYLLCDAFGNIPIVDKFIYPQGFLPATVRRDTVVSFIINELKSNMDSLNSANSKLTYGRMNQWAAKFILARTYLNSEAWTGVAKYDSCLLICNQILAKEGSLFTMVNYKDNFLLINEISTESIFNIPMDEKVPGAIIYMAYRKTLDPAEQARYHFNGSWLDDGGCATPSFIDTWDTLDQRLGWTFIWGQRYGSDGKPLKCNGFVAGWNGKPLIYTKKVTSLESAGEPDGYRFQKYEVKAGGLITTDNDWVWFRLPYVKFMKAECLLRTGGDAKVAADLVNSVRKRAFNASVWPTKQVTATDLTATYNLNGVPTQFGRMCMEYAWEFALEGHRREELIRFGNFVTGAWTFHTPTKDPARNIFPIPANQLLTNSKLKQNPGYN